MAYAHQVIDPAEAHVDWQVIPTEWKSNGHPDSPQYYRPKFAYLDVTEADKATGNADVSANFRSCATFAYLDENILRAKY